jgi:hypothetical protein
MIVKQYRTFKLLYENKSVEYILYLCSMYMHLFLIFYLEHNITSYELAERGGKCYLFLSYLIWVQSAYTSNINKECILLIYFHITI